MKLMQRRLLAKAMVCGFLLTAAAGFLPFGAACAALPENVLRLHVVAASDSPEDQALKLKVRDAVLEEAAHWAGDAESMEEASARLCLHLGAIRRRARQVLRQNGCSDEVTVQLRELSFPTRTYEGFQLPAGNYRALRVTIGEGAGKNWWCVVFPALCLPAAAKREDCLALLPEAERSIAVNGEKYRVGFKLVEWYETLRRAVDR